MQSLRFLKRNLPQKKVERSLLSWRLRFISYLCSVVSLLLHLDSHSLACWSHSSPYKPFTLTLYSISGLFLVCKNFCFYYSIETIFSKLFNHLLIIRFNCLSWNLYYLISLTTHTYLKFFQILDFETLPFQISSYLSCQNLSVSLWISFSGFLNIPLNCAIASQLFLLSFLSIYSIGCYDHIYVHNFHT